MEKTCRSIFITGGTGFVGSAVSKAWLAQDAGHKAVVQTRDPNRARAESDGRAKERIQYVSSYAEVTEDVYGIVNLAGAPIADKRWSLARRKVLEDSRIALTETLVDEVKVSPHPPQVVVSASAIGYYGTGTTSVDESSSIGDGYAAALCLDWEAAAMGFTPHARLTILRLGVVLGRGGMLDKLLPMYKLGMGGPIAGGRQYLSWVHLCDVVTLVLRALSDETMEGVYNASSPEPVRQADFAKALGAALSRPAIVPTPGFVLSAVFGQMADELLIAGQKVLPARTRGAGFEFRFPTINGAIEDVIASNS